MAINIPGLSLSILRQQTTVQSGLPLLVSGRFTAFGIGVPALIRVFLEGPSYDPQIRSFDTFASPFSGDYTVNVIAEKDGSYNVYSQAFPPPIMPTGPPFPDALLLLPAMAESTRPPLAVGYPFDGGVEALLPDGSRQRLDAPAMQPIEFRPLITVGAPAISIGGFGAPAQMPALPWFPGITPSAPPGLPGFPTYARAVVDEILFSPPLINPGMEAVGVMAWRNTGEAPTSFDSVYYLISTDGVRYGPLQSTQNVSVNPQIPTTQNIRLTTSGLPSGTYSVDVEIYDSATGTFVTSRTLPSRLEIREIGAPVIPLPPVIPPPVIPVTPTLDILGTPSLYLPGQIQVGDVWSGSISLPTFSTVPVFIDSRLLIRDLYGYEYIVAQGGRTLNPGEYLSVPVNLDTTGFTPGDYTILLRAFGPSGIMLTEFPMGILSMIAAALPEIPELVPPPLPTGVAPTLPTFDMFSTPSINLPTQVEIGEIWQGNVTIPTMVPAALKAFPSLPAFPVDIGLKLQSPSGQMFDVGSWRPSFTPGQNINLPVNFDTSLLSEQGVNNLIMEISDIQGNPLFSNAISTLRSMLPEIPEIPGLPEIPGVPLPSKFSLCVVLMGAQTVQVGGSVTIPFTFVHVGREEVVVCRAAVGDARPVYLGGFDEVWHQDKTVSVPNHAVPTVVRESITIPITHIFQGPGIYSVYAKVDGGIPRTISPVIPNIIEVVGVPEVPELPSADIKDFNINLLTIGPFDPGSTGSFTATCRYRGRAQGGAIKIELGTGIVGTFFSKFRLQPEIAVSFRESFDWQDFSFRGNFTIPDIAEKGEKYNLRATIQTFADPTKESETDWGVIEITALPSIPSSQFSRVEIDAALGFPVVHHGETLQVPVNYTHLGKADTARVYAAIGEWGTVFGFDEKAHGETSITVPDDSVIRTRQAIVNITIPTTLEAGRHDLYAKVNGEQSSPVLQRVHVVALVPLPSSEFSGVSIVRWPSSTPPGGTLELSVSFNHEGEGESEWLYAAIGNEGVFGFDEKVTNQRAITVPGTPGIAAYRETITIQIPTTLPPGTYDVYAKIGKGFRPRAISPTRENVIRVVAEAPPPEAAGQYTLKVTIEPPGAGLVLISSKAPYSAGEVVTLVATPNPGYEFDHWGGWPPYPGIQSTSDTLNITMTANWWVVAAFRERA